MLSKELLEYKKHNIKLIIKYCKLLQESIKFLPLEELIKIEHILYYNIISNLEKEWRKC